MYVVSYCHHIAITECKEFIKNINNSSVFLGILVFQMKHQANKPRTINIVPDVNVRNNNESGTRFSQSH